MSSPSTSPLGSPDREYIRHLSGKIEMHSQQWNSPLWGNTCSWLDHYSLWTLTMDFLYTYARLRGMCLRECADHMVRISEENISHISRDGRWQKVEWDWRSPWWTGQHDERVEKRNTSRAVTNTALSFFIRLTLFLVIWKKSRRSLRRGIDVLVVLVRWS